jgi:hypothetical protein
MNLTKPHAHNLAAGLNPETRDFIAGWFADASFFTRDIDRSICMARRLPCGTVSVNDFSEGDVKTPFGGYRKSGSLACDNGAEAMDQHFQTKTIWICAPRPRSV